MISGHGGNIYQAARQIGCRPEDIVDMSSNMNPMGPPPGLKDHVIAHIDDMVRLPEAAAESLVAAFARRHALDPQMILAGGGTTQFIHILPPALDSRRVLIVGPTYADYADACRLHRIAHELLVCSADRQFEVPVERLAEALPRCDTVFICNPNNPTGTLLDGDHLRRLCRRHPSVRFVVDESYLPFAPDADRHSLLPAVGDNVLVLQSMSKIYRIPGLRIGFLAASADIIDRIRPFLWPWGVSSAAQTAAHYILANSKTIDAFIATSRSLIAAEQRRLIADLADCRRYRPYPSGTVFRLLGLQAPLTADVVSRRLLQHRILVRNCANFDGLSAQCIRVSLKTPAENDRLIGALQDIDRMS